MPQGKHNTVHKYGGQKKKRSIIVYNVCLTCNNGSKILALSFLDWKNFINIKNSAKKITF